MKEKHEVGEVDEVYLALRINRVDATFEFVVIGGKYLNDKALPTEVGEQVLDDTLNSLAAAARAGWRWDDGDENCGRMTGTLDS